MAKALDPAIRDILQTYGEEAKAALWDCHGTWVIYHKAVERIAAKAGIVFDPPKVIQADARDKIAVIMVSGSMGDRSEWSFGEAMPSNNKNAYPFAMAEKRAKDRVALKLVGLHGFVYSEDESDDFKPVNNNTAQVEKPRKDEAARKVFRQLVDQIRKTGNVDDLNALVLDKDFHAATDGLPADWQDELRREYAKARDGFIAAQSTLMAGE